LHGDGSEHLERSRGGHPVFRGGLDFRGAAGRLGKTNRREYKAGDNSDSQGSEAADCAGIAHFAGRKGYIFPLGREHAPTIATPTSRLVSSFHSRAPESGEFTPPGGIAAEQKAAADQSQERCDFRERKDSYRAPVNARVFDTSERHSAQWPPVVGSEHDPPCRSDNSAMKPTEGTRLYISATRPQRPR